jgi:hypothetical protein
VTELGRLLDALGPPYAYLDRAQSFIASIESADHRPALATQNTSSEIAHRIAQLAAVQGRRLEQLAREVQADLAGAALHLATCHQAAVHWEQVASQPAEVRRALLTVGWEFHTSGLSEFLCEKSVEAAGDSAERAAELADLAVLVAYRVAGTDGWRPDWRLRQDT